MASISPSTIQRLSKSIGADRTAAIISSITPYTTCRVISKPSSIVFDTLDYLQNKTVWKSIEPKLCTKKGPFNKIPGIMWKTSNNVSIGVLDKDYNRCTPKAQKSCFAPNTLKINGDDYHIYNQYSCLFTTESHSIAKFAIFIYEVTDGKYFIYCPYGKSGKHELRECTSDSPKYVDDNYKKYDNYKGAHGETPDAKNAGKETRSNENSNDDNTENVESVDAETEASRQTETCDELVDKLVDSLKKSKNQILYGPPGTGKTYHTIDKALEILGYEGPDDRAEKLKAFKRYRDVEHRIVFTTFHQSMSYEDFVEGIKPVMTSASEESVGYRIEDGIFKKIALKAAEAKKTAADSGNSGDINYVLIIDEINRGNIANIFGELITLIEDSKRAGEKEAISVKLPYSKETFSVPNNLYIIGTMNTADRSVEALDSALRRRFVFEEMMPCPDLLKDVKVKNLDISLKDLLETINGRIEILKDREHQIGHSYFMGFVKGEACEIEAEKLLPVFKNNIIPLLQEYFYGDYEKILLVLGDGFIERKTASVKFAGNQSYDDVPENIYSIKDVSETKAEDAIKKLMNK